ncbi:MAG: hypothetical protein V3R71_08130 [Gemmatimonadales bacterium]
MKINGAMTWVLSICGTLVTASAMGSTAMLWNVTNDVSAIKASMATIDERVDRQDTRWTRVYDQLDSRLRDVELGDR